MRKWGIVITMFYVAVLAVVVLPLVPILSGNTDSVSTVLWGWYPWPWSPDDWSVPSTPGDIQAVLYFGLWCLILITGQAIMLFVSVDTSFRRLRPRRHILVSVAGVSMLVALLGTAVIVSIGVAIRGDDLSPYALISIVPLWLLWGLIFYGYKAGMPDRLKAMTGWLIKGSILEMLIVVPCHVIVRQRGDCCAPGVTAFGIATGIAIMLLAFGPSVLFLYQKRLGEYRRPDAAGSG